MLLSSKRKRKVLLGFGARSLMMTLEHQFNGNGGNRSSDSGRKTDPCSKSKQCLSSFTVRGGEWGQGLEIVMIGM